MEKEKLLKEFEEKFNKIKKELKFKTSLEELDDAFFVKDSVLKDGFISENISRQICYKIMETFVGWNDYLHSLIMPNPQNILNMSESKIFDHDERKEITELMKQAMEINSKNAVLGLKKNHEETGRFIDSSYDSWENKFKPKLIVMMEKINKEWGKKE
jgi:hypothetical protein